MSMRRSHEVTEYLAPTGDEPVVLALFWEQPGQGREDGSVWPGGTRSGDPYLAAQHRDFMAEHEQLGVLGRLPAPRAGSAGQPRNCRKLR